jgi:thiamine biosynthesis lipoprotein
MIFLWAGCRPATVRETRMQMGTRVEITAAGKDRGVVAARVEAAFGEIDRLEGLMSPFRPESEVSRINRAAGAAPVAVSPEVFEVIARSLEVSRVSEGAFDLTFAALSELWDFSGKKPRRVPEAAAIAGKLKLVGFGRVQLDPKARTVFLPERGMQIGLGGIAKGYIVDKALAVLKVDGVERALVNAGGDLRSFARPGERPWKIGIQDPRRRERLLGELEITNLAAATSGQYERFVEIEGRRYGHILDPRTGWPAAGCRSVTVLAGEAWEADALATALFVLGPARGMALLRSRPGVEAMIVDAEGRGEMSAGFEKRLGSLK